MRPSSFWSLAKMKLDSKTYIKVVDAVSGVESFIESPEGQGLLSALKAVIAPRLSENSTHLGAAVLAVGAPTLIDQAVTAITLGLAGDYVGCIKHAIPVIIGVWGTVKAIISPESKTPSPVPVN